MVKSKKNSGIWNKILSTDYETVISMIVVISILVVIVGGIVYWVYGNNVKKHIIEAYTSPVPVKVIEKGRYYYLPSDPMYKNIRNAYTYDSEQAAIEAGYFKHRYIPVKAYYTDNHVATYATPSDPCYKNIKAFKNFTSEEEAILAGYERIRKPYQPVVGFVSDEISTSGHKYYATPDYSDYRLYLFMSASGNDPKYIRFNSEKTALQNGYRKAEDITIYEDKELKEDFFYTSKDAPYVDVNYKYPVPPTWEDCIQAGYFYGGQTFPRRDAETERQNTFGKLAVKISLDGLYYLPKDPLYNYVPVKLYTRSESQAINLGALKHKYQKVKVYQRGSMKYYVLPYDPAYFKIHADKIFNSEEEAILAGYSKTGRDRRAYISTANYDYAYIYVVDNLDAFKQRYRGNQIVSKVSSCTEKDAVLFGYAKEQAVLGNDGVYVLQGEPDYSQFKLKDATYYDSEETAILNGLTHKEFQ